MKIARRLASERRSAASARAFSVAGLDPGQRGLDRRADPGQVALEQIVGGAGLHAADGRLLVDRAGDDQERRRSGPAPGPARAPPCRRSGAGCSRRGSGRGGTRRARGETRRGCRRSGHRRECWLRRSSYSTSSASIGTSSRIRIRSGSGGHADSCAEKTAGATRVPGAHSSMAICTNAVIMAQAVVIRSRLGL